MKKTTKVLASLLFVGVLFSACGEKNTQSTPEDAVKSFLNGLFFGDWASISKTLDDNWKGRFEDMVIETCSYDYINELGREQNSSKKPLTLLKKIQEQKLGDIAENINLLEKSSPEKKEKFISICFKTITEKRKKEQKMENMDLDIDIISSEINDEGIKARVEVKATKMPKKTLKLEKINNEWKIMNPPF